VPSHLKGEFTATLKFVAKPFEIKSEKTTFTIE